MKVLTIGSAMQDIFILHSTPESIELDTKQGKKCFLILQEGIKIEVQDLVTSIGGGATNSAVSFARLGFETSSFFKTGNDEAAKCMHNSLKKENINLVYACKTNDKSTGSSIIIPCLSGERTTFVYRGANLSLKKNEIPIKAIRQTDLLYVTSLSGPLAPLLPFIVKQPEKNTLVACNPGTSQLKGGIRYLQEALTDIDVFILNGLEARLLLSAMLETDETLKANLRKKIDSNPSTHSPSQSIGEHSGRTGRKKTIHGNTSSNSQPLHKAMAGTEVNAVDLACEALAKKAPFEHIPELLNPQPMANGLHFDLTLYFKEILASGPRIAVVTNGADGVYVAHQNTILYYPSLKVKTESTLGAGDAFGSTFAAYIAEKKPIETALFAGIINAASVIGHLDTQMGLLNKNELENKIKKIDQTKLQQFLF